MTNRVTQLWLPGLAAFVLSGGILALIQILAFEGLGSDEKRRFDRRALRLVVDSVAANRRGRRIPVMARGRLRARHTLVHCLSGAAVPYLDFSGASCESDLRQIYRPQHRADVFDFCSVWLGASSRGSPSRRRLNHPTLSFAALKRGWRREPLTFLGSSSDRRGVRRESGEVQSLTGRDVG